MAKRQNEHTQLPVPNGWFAVEFSHDLRDGEVEPISYCGEEFMNAVTAGVREDLDIWKYKVHRARPMLTKEDRFIADFRRWARQFSCESTADEEAR